MKRLLTVIPILAVLPVVAADPRPSAPTPFQLELPRPTTPPIPTTDVRNWAGGDRVPIFDRLHLGGANNLRGFKFRDVSPKDENGEPIRDSLWRLTAEYTFPVIDKIRGAVLYDVGFVNAGDYDFSTGNVSSDVGIGLRLALPIGPVRLDYGIPLQHDANDDSSGGFRWNGDFPGAGYREQRARFLNK